MKPKHISYLCSMIMEWKNLNALVCGASQGIGKATAFMLAASGAHVTLMARDEEKLKSVLGELPQNGSQKHQILVADFSNNGQVESTIKSFSEKNEIHILVNNTGGPNPGKAHEAGIDEFRMAFNLHLINFQIITQALLPKMKTHGYGRIINVISTSVKQPLPNLGVSNTIRGAVANWSKTLASELGPYGITVNNVLPGATATGRLEQIMQNKAAKTGVSKDEVETEMKSEIPLGRLALPEEIAAGIHFLASPAASYINGINLPIDGGRTACL
jgi:3-oxoacyl-[acyl-carrier protein] reductase